MLDINISYALQRKIQFRTRELEVRYNILYKDSHGSKKKRDARIIEDIHSMTKLGNWLSLVKGT